MSDDTPSTASSSRLDRTERLSLVQEMRESFLDYSMSVIVQRALPDARDGLKPVHRRILQTLHDERLYPDREHKKSAAVVGTALGRYHPHGDSAVYDAMVRMAQDFSMNHPLVDGQGNFGSLDGDSAAAYRYTEARMAPVAAEMLEDLEKGTVDFVSTFDDRHEEPSVLPSRFPNLLVNGTEGIAVGMSTKIPPHNLREVGAAIALLCDDPDAPDEAVYDHIQGPDFPTGGLVLRKGGIDQFLRTGRGKMRMRARVHSERSRGGRTRLIFTEIPYGVVKGNILSAIARHVKSASGTDHWASAITDLRDESDRTGVRLVVELKRGADVQRVLERLYKKTTLAKTYGGRLLALVGQTPELLSVRRALELFIEHRLEVIQRRAEHDLAKARHRAHVLEGLLVAIDAVEEVVDLIRRSQRRDTARKKLMKAFDLTEVQANAILDLRLARLTSMDVKQLSDELDEKRQAIADLEALLDDEALQRETVRDETREVVETYGRERRTRVVTPEEADTVVEQAADEYVRLEWTRTDRTYARLAGQKRGRSSSRRTDPALRQFSVKTDQRVVLFTDTGTAYSLYPDDVLEASSSRPALSAVVEGLSADERVLHAMAPEEVDHGGSILYVSERGRVKRTPVTEYEAPRAGGLIAAGCYEGDRWVAVLHVLEEMDVLVATAGGQAIRFPVDDVPSHGRSAKGVKGITLADGDRVVSASRAGADVVVVTEHGFVKRVDADAFPTQGRGGKGVILNRVSEDTGPVVCGLSIGPDRQLLAWPEGDDGVEPTRIDPGDLPLMGRNTYGQHQPDLVDGRSLTRSWIVHG